MPNRKERPVTGQRQPAFMTTSDVFLNAGGVFSTVMTSRYAEGYVTGKKEHAQARMAAAPPACPVRKIPTHLERFGKGKKYPVAQYDQNFTLITPKDIDQTGELKLKPREQLVLAINPETRRPALYKAPAGKVKSCSTQQDRKILELARDKIIVNGICAVSWGATMCFYGYLVDKNIGNEQQRRTGGGRRRRGGGGGQAVL